MTWQSERESRPCAGGCGRIIPAVSRNAKCACCRIIPRRMHRGDSYAEKASKMEMQHFEEVCKKDEERIRAYRERLRVDPEKVWE